MRTLKTIAFICFTWLSGLAAIPCRGDTFAVVVGGISKDAADRAANAKVMTDLQNYLRTRAKVPPAGLRLLAADTNSPSTASAITEALDGVAAKAGPQDRFIFWYVGQANAIGGHLRLNLPGPDLTHEDLAAHLVRIKAGTMLIVLDCPNAALAVKALSSPGRVILCASKEDQPYGTQLSRHFVPALTAAESAADKNGKVSVLEAFAAAARQIEQWYRDRQMLPTETPCLDDNGDGTASEQPWRTESTDGAVASKLFLDL